MTTLTEDQAQEVADDVLAYADVQGPVTVAFDERFGPDTGIDAMTLFTDPPRILLGRHLLDDRNELVNALVHEISHLLSGDPGHGPAYHEQLKQLLDPQRLGDLLEPHPEQPIAKPTPRAKKKAT